MTVVSGECNTGLLDEPDCVRIKMAATTAANQLKLEEMESARTMLLFVEGFTIAALARTMERVTRCVHLQLPQAPTGLLWDKEFAFGRLGPVCLALDHSSTEQSPDSTVRLLFSMPQYNIARPQLQTHMSDTHTRTLPSLLSSHTTLGGPLFPDRRGETVFKSSPKPYSCSIKKVNCAVCLVVLPYAAPPLPRLCPLSICSFHRQRTSTPWWFISGWVSAR